MDAHPISQADGRSFKARLLCREGHQVAVDRHPERADHRTRFEAEMGVSIRRYRASYQLSRAASLLRQPELSLGRVAELSGFNSQAVFSRFVRRETGLTPSAWRRSLA